MSGSNLARMADPAQPYTGTPPQRRNPLRPARIGWEVAVWLALWALCTQTVAVILDTLWFAVPYAVIRAGVMAVQYRSWCHHRDVRA